MLFLFSFENLIYGINIPQDEKIFLERGVIQMFFLEHFVYTLNGVKAVSLSGLSNNSFNNTNFIKLENEIKKMGLNFSKVSYLDWNICKRHFINLPMKKFILLEDSQSGFDCLLFIHKQSFIKCCDTYKKLFQEVLGYDFDAQKALIQLESGSISFYKLLKQNDALLGVLLGYGLKNSQAFENECYGLFHEIPRQLNERDFDSTLLDYIGSPPNFFHRVNPVWFVGFPNDKETISLADLYARKHAELNRKYREPHFLELILSELTEE